MSDATKTYTSLGLVKTAEGAIEIAVGGRYELSESDGDLARMSDSQLRKLRSTFVDKRGAIRAEYNALDSDARYNTPEGAALSDDLYYYNSLLSRVECEMQCRMITLD